MFGRVAELQGAGVPPFAHHVHEHELLPSRVIEQVGDPGVQGLVGRGPWYRQPTVGSAQRHGPVQRLAGRQLWVAGQRDPLRQRVRLPSAADELGPPMSAAGARR